MTTAMRQVLVMDDDADIRACVRLVLEDAGYSVLEAADDTQALCLLRTSAQPLVVLLDLVMRGRDGAALLRAIQHDTHLGRHCYVVVTGKAKVSLPADLQDLIAATCLDLVEKPIDLDVLLAAVRRAEAHLTVRAVPPPSPPCQ